jgi:hypothetical protein
MQAGGMSAVAIRRALGLSEAAATELGLLEPARLATVPGPVAAARSTPGPGGPGGGPGGPGGGPGGDLGGDLGIAEVLDAVSRGTGIGREALTGPGQQQPAVRARHLVMCLSRELCPAVSVVAIGQMLDRDRATVVYGCRRAALLLERDRDFRKIYLSIRRVLTAGTRKAGSHG